MPTDLENAKLMFLCLQHSTATGFDYKKIGEACGITAGAASKRMSRLKQAVNAGKDTGLDVRYLWSCIQNSDMKDIDFTAIGKELGLSNGAASKRWSRLKQALERGETGSTAPNTPATGKEGNSGKKVTGGGKKRKKAGAEDDDEAGETDVKKGKRKSAIAAASQIKPEDSDAEGDDISKETPEQIITGYAAVSENKPASKQVAATVPKKSTAAATAATASERKTKSTPRRRPLTDEEVYGQLDVYEAAEHELKNLSSGRDTYPKHHSLLEAFLAVRTPDKGGFGASASNSNANANANKTDNPLFSEPDISSSMPPAAGADRSPPDLNDLTPDPNGVFSKLVAAAKRPPTSAEQRHVVREEGDEYTCFGEPPSTAASETIKGSPAVDNSQGSPWYSVSPHWADVARQAAPPYGGGGGETYGGYQSFFAGEQELGEDEDYV